MSVLSGNADTFLSCNMPLKVSLEAQETLSGLKPTYILKHYRQHPLAEINLILQERRRK